MRWQYLVIIIVILIGGFIADRFGFLEPIKNAAYSSTKTTLIGFNKTIQNFGDFFRTFSSIKALTDENKRLKEENLTLVASNAGLLELQRQNEILKNELGFIQNNKDKKLIAAQIVARPPAGYLHYITLDKGKEDGVEEGDLVIYANYLVGRVDKVLDNFSQVLLITNSNSLIPVVLQESRATGILHGSLSGMVVEEIPLDAKVVNGENVLTRALESNVTEGILVGKVSGLVSKQSEIFQKTTIESPVDFNKLEFVFIIK